MISEFVAGSAAIVAAPACTVTGCSEACWSCIAPTLPPCACMPVPVPVPVCMPDCSPPAVPVVPLSPPPASIAPPVEIPCP